jgi:hypothetical protein
MCSPTLPLLSRQSSMPGHLGNWPGDNKCRRGKVRQLWRKSNPKFVVVAKFCSLKDNDSRRVRLLPSFHSVLLSWTSPHFIIQFCDLFWLQNELKFGIIQESFMGPCSSLWTSHLIVAKSGVSCTIALQRFLYASVNGGTPPLYMPACSCLEYLQAISL